VSPYKSAAQERFFHTNTAKKKGITPAVVQEFDSASKGMKLPKKAKKKAKPR
jgi:hypothetical protein